MWLGFATQMDTALCKTTVAYCAKMCQIHMSQYHSAMAISFSFFGFSCPLLSTIVHYCPLLSTIVHYCPLHRKVADKDYTNNGLGDLAGFIRFRCVPTFYWCTALVAALLYAPFKTRRVEIWWNEMRWNEMKWYVIYVHIWNEWLRVTPNDSKAMSATWKMTRPAAMASCAGCKIHLRAWVRSNASSWPRNGAMRYLGYLIPARSLTIC